MSIRSLLRRAAAPASLALLTSGALAGTTDTPTPATAGPPALPAPAAPITHPDFSGNWQLDPGASDDPAKIAATAGRQGQDRQTGGPGGGGRGPAVDPNQGLVPGEGFDGADARERERAESLGRQAEREFSVLEIFHAGDEFDLTDGMQISRMLQIGGPLTDVFTPRGPVKASAAWEADALTVTERDPKGDVQRTRQFLLSADRNTLTVREIHHQPGRNGSQTVTLVYRRQMAAEKP